MGSATEQFLIDDVTIDSIPWATVTPGTNPTITVDVTLMTSGEKTIKHEKGNNTKESHKIHGCKFTKGAPEIEVGTALYYHPKQSEASYIF